MVMSSGKRKEYKGFNQPKIVLGKGPKRCFITPDMHRRGGKVLVNV
jgi:hypothetical protein